MKYNDLIIGAKYEETRLVTTEDVLHFANLSGDFNPVHTNEEHAQNTIFGGRIVHGMLVASYISKAIATDMPGPGAIYMQQNLNFIKPIYHNSFISIVIEVQQLKVDKKIVFLNTSVWMDNILVVQGDAVVKCTD